jgi:hypothetical protein
VEPVALVRVDPDSAAPVHGLSRELRRRALDDGKVEVAARLRVEAVERDPVAVRGLGERDEDLAGVELVGLQRQGDVSVEALGEEYSRPA